MSIACKVLELLHFRSITDQSKLHEKNTIDVPYSGTLLATATKGRLVRVNLTTRSTCGLFTGGDEKQSHRGDLTRNQYCSIAIFGSTASQFSGVCLDTYILCEVY